MQSLVLRGSDIHPPNSPETFSGPQEIPIPPHTALPVSATWLDSFVLLPYNFHSLYSFVYIYICSQGTSHTCHMLHILAWPPSSPPHQILIFQQMKTAPDAYLSLTYWCWPTATGPRFAVRGCFSPALFILNLRKLFFLITSCDDILQLFLGSCPQRRRLLVHAMRFKNICRSTGNNPERFKQELIKKSRTQGSKRFPFRTVNIFVTFVMQFDMSLKS